MNRGVLTSSSRLSIGLPIEDAMVRESRDRPATAAVASSYPYDRRRRRGGYNLGTPNDVRTERWCGSEVRVITPYQNILGSCVS